MKNNKIYMTLAHLYGQFKDVVGNTGRSLSEEIDARVANSQEVVNARGNYGTLSDRMNGIDHSVDNVTNDVNANNQVVYENRMELDHVKTTIQEIKDNPPLVKLDNGDTMLVKLDNKISNTATEFSLYPNERKMFKSNLDTCTNELFVRCDIDNTEVKFEYSAANTEYDAHNVIIQNKTLIAADSTEYKLPLEEAVIIPSDGAYIAAVPGFCNIQGIYKGDSSTLKNNVCNVFKTGYKWSSRTNRSEIIIDFVREIYITDIRFNVYSNTQQQSVAVFLSNNDAFEEVMRVPSSDKIIRLNKMVKKMKLSFDALSALSTTLIEVSDVSIHTRGFVSNSNITSIKESIFVGDVSGYGRIAELSDFNDVANYYFALKNGSSDNYIIYYPKTRNIPSDLFINKSGFKNYGVLKNTIEKTLMADYVYIPSKGTEGASTIPLNFGPMSWKDYYSYSISGGMKINNLSYLTLHIRVLSAWHKVELQASDGNTTKVVTLDGVQVRIRVKGVRTDGFGIYVDSDVQIKDVRYKISVAQSLSRSGDTEYYIYDNSSYVTDDLVDTARGLHNVFTTYYWRSTYRPHGYGCSSSHWSYSHASLNQTLAFSVAAFDNNNIKKNPANVTITSNGTVRELDYTISNVRESSIYIGPQYSILDILNKDGVLAAADDYVESSSHNEYVCRVNIHRGSEIVNIEPKAQTYHNNDIEYFLSNNNYEFMTYNELTGNWVVAKTGMTGAMLKNIPSHAYRKLLNRGFLYIKVKINTQQASLSGIDITFDSEQFITANDSSIEEYGMGLSDLKSIPAEYLSKIIDQDGKLEIVTLAKAKLQCYQFKIPGFTLREYGGYAWTPAEESKVKMLVSGDMLGVTNITNGRQVYRLNQKSFHEDVVIIGDEETNAGIDSVASEVEVLKNSSDMLSQKLDTVSQNLGILHESLMNGTTPPADLPSFILNDTLEVDLPVLSPGASAVIDGVCNLRHIQYWDTQDIPTTEAVTSITTKQYESLFINSNGFFKSDYFEVGKGYDTNNAYLMTRSVFSDKITSFKTSEYTCTSKNPLGNTISPRHNYSVARILSGPEDAIGSWWQWLWASNQSNVVYDLPGEDIRWVDIDFEFNEPKYIYSINEMDFGAAAVNIDSPSDYRTNYTWQITTIFLDYDGSNNWVEHAKWTGMRDNLTCIIGKEVRKIRIRIEVPYSYYRGAARVAFKYLDIYYCPIRYIHDEYAVISPISFIETSSFKEILATHSNAKIDGTNADIRYFIENDAGGFGYYSGDRWYWIGQLDYTKGMTLSTFNNLSKSALTILKDSNAIRPVAMLNSVAGHHSPRLYDMSISYAQHYSKNITLVNPFDITTKFDPSSNAVTVTNVSSANKTLRAVIS